MCTYAKGALVLLILLWLHFVTMIDEVAALPTWLSFYNLKTKPRFLEIGCSSCEKRRAQVPVPCRQQHKEN